MCICVGGVIEYVCVPLVGSVSMCESLSVLSVLTVLNTEEDLI